MFSGIVQAACPVVHRESLPGLLRLTIDLGELVTGLRHGASVSVAGVCLTVVSQDAGHVTFEIMQETLEKTTLGELRTSDAINIERSVRIGDEIGGHRVSGHVTGVAVIRNIDQSQNQHTLTIGVDPAWIEAIIPKGFIALDGCSLTVIEVGTDWFTVSLIPETLRMTTFGGKKEGDRMNLELDPETQAIVATVKRYLAINNL